VALISNLVPHYRRPLYELLAQRFELDCYFFAESEPYWNPLLPANVGGEFTQVPMRRIRVLGEPLLPGLIDRLGRSRYDAVIVGLTGRLMVPYVYAIARTRKVPFVLWSGVWHHPETAFHRLTRRVVEALYRRSDAIVVYGEHVRAALLSVGVPDEKIFTAAQAVAAERFSGNGDPAGSREIVFVGQFEEHKGLRDLLAAFASVSDPTVTLSLIGNGSLEGELCTASALDPRIAVIGHLPQEELPQRLASARCLVLPSITTASYREAWGLVVNEAMHAGIPVVATDAVGAAAAGLVVDGVTGLVVPERDPAALAAALGRIVGDDALAAELGREAKTRVARYTFDAMADAFEAAVNYARRQRGEAMT
jgi:glycosyltransferase involved in cell wall biosynthesis